MSSCPYCGHQAPDNAHPCPNCGAAISASPHLDLTGLEAELRQLLAEGKTLQAINRYKDATATSLTEAKNAVEAIERGASLQPPALSATSGMDDALAAELGELLRQGQKIQAVKRYKDRTGASLMASKKAVEAFQAGRGLPMPQALDAQLAAELLPSLRMGEKREAIRIYQKRTGAGHREAKRTVAALAKQHGLYDRESALLTTALLLLGIGGVLLLLVGGAVLFLG